MALGSRLAHHLKKGDLVALSGVFGAGKTYFTKGMARGLGIKDTRQITSPTFLLSQVYPGKRVKLYHFDAQRLEEPNELLSLGLTDALRDGVCVVEWADKCQPFLKLSQTIYVKFRLTGKTTRILHFKASPQFLSWAKH